MTSNLRTDGPPRIPIEGCAPVPVRANADHRGCLFEIFREEWAGAFKTVQWNACRSLAGVMRGVHVHVDYDEFYTLPWGRVFLALRDIRRASPTFGNSIGFEWSAADGFAIPVPAGIAHAVFFLNESILAFGLSDYWNAETDGIISTHRCVGRRKPRRFQTGTGRQDHLPICSLSTRRCPLRS